MPGDEFFIVEQPSACYWCNKPLPTVTSYSAQLFNGKTVYFCTEACQNKELECPF